MPACFRSYKNKVTIKHEEEILLTGTTDISKDNEANKKKKKDGGNECIKSLLIKIGGEEMVRFSFSHPSWQMDHEAVRLNSLKVTGWDLKEDNTIRWEKLIN